MSNWKAWLALALLLGVGWALTRAHPVARADGVLAPAAPVQQDFGTPPAPVAFKGATLRPRATFALTARVLARDDYRFDAGAGLSPVDLALGWGRMSDSAVLRYVDISQGARFYRWQVRSFPIPRREIETHSANMHLIPADAGIARTLKRVRAGDVVTLEGWLVDATRGDGWAWRTSMTRDDTGAGACELVYVRALDIGPR